jgi:hypothetical protein
MSLFLYPMCPSFTKSNYARPEELVTTASNFLLYFLSLFSLSLVIHTPRIFIDHRGFSQVHLLMSRPRI